jgi:hypothetical protein
MFWPNFIILLSVAEEGESLFEKITRKNYLFDGPPTDTP